MTFDEIWDILSRKTVGIAGLGGLGSNCAAALTRCGIGTLVLADFDIVSESNLNRQFYFHDQVGMKKTSALTENLLRIRPSVVIRALDVRLNEENIREIFGQCDVLIEAFDQACQKQMLVETVLTQMPLTPLIVGVGMAGWGMNDSIHCRRSGNLIICGDEVSEISPSLPPIAPRVGIVSNMQANVALEILLNDGCKHGNITE
ncbi:MAG TPA: sulfur carrier protein ThiS adenylyltransferase ThiF [Bacteroidales bacterium]|mgnify:CR=1 FL=1|nr:sulfur carrier protein ThiS adenylyltransferase ThiF [Bacteroidales bacterium]